MKPIKFHFSTKESAFRRIVAKLLPLLVVIGIGAATEIVLHLERSRQLVITQQNAISHSGELRAIIETELSATIHLATGVAAYIKTHKGQVETTQLAPWLLELQKNARHIRNISLAPDNRIQIIVPLEGNESALGLYYPDNKTQWPAVEKVILGKKPVLAGPFKLKQGGNGLAYRIPIFLENGDYWGMVSTILDADSIFGVANQRAQQLQLAYVILDKDLPSAEQLVYGKPDFAHGLGIGLEINAPARNLSLIGMPSADELSPALTIIERLAGWTVALSLGILIAFMFRSYRRQHLAYFALNESQQRFLGAYNTAPQGMALVDQEQHWISVNPMLCEMLGITENNLLKIPTTQLNAALSQEQLMQRWLHRGGDNVQFELTLLHVNGTQVYCLFSIALIQNENLHAPYWIFQVIDISRRIQAEKELRASADYTQAILDNVADGIVSVSFEGKICSINPAAKAIWQLPEEAYQTCNFFDCLETQNDDTIKQEILEFVNFLEDSSPGVKPCLTRESVITNQHGASMTIEFSISATDQAARRELIIVVHDITERKRLETMQREFVSTVSHELRTPLTSIIGSLKLIEGGIFGQLPSSLEKMVSIALQNGRQLALIINDILDMDKLNAGKMEFNIQQYAIMPLVEQAVEANRLYAKQHQVKFTIMNHLPDCEVMVDQQRLQQILSNLLSNASKYSHPYGDIELHLIKEKNHLRIEVRDFGEGISDEYKERVFQKFSQEDGSNTRQKGGTGLGLSICKEMVEHMHGQIGFHSKQAEGSTFFFTVPLASSVLST